MVKKQILKVNTFGKLKIYNKTSEFPQEKKRSAQVELLLIYLILNLNLAINNQQLITLLWPNGDADKPEGALRNLVYRVRKEMRMLFDFPVDCIKAKGRSYYWNLEIKCQVDYEPIIRLSKKIKLENDPIRKYQFCLEMVSLYQGEILPDFNYNSWVFELNKSIKQKVIDAIDDTITVLNQYKMNKEILDICNKNIDDMMFYEIKLNAYYNCGNYNEALSFYHWVVDYYHSKYGLEVSQNLKNIYNLVLNKQSLLSMNIDQLDNYLNHDDNKNALYLDYDLFKSVYQYTCRMVQQTMQPQVLALLTLVKEKEEADIEKGHLLLKQVINENLKSSDVFSKVNQLQFALILNCSNIESAKILLQNIDEAFVKAGKAIGFKLTSELKMII